MSTLHGWNQFNGAVLVAVQGKVIYRNALGPANFETRSKLTPETPFCLASLTKQFTAMAIMVLAERNKLNYDDAVAKYIPEFSRSSKAGKITIRAPPPSKITVFLLANRGNSKRVEINDAILGILRGKSYVLPKMSGAEKLYETTRESGVRAAIQMYGSLAKSGDYDMSESELNTLGYQLLYGDKRVSEAVAIFKLNADEHSTSSNAFDSLGEACQKEGDKDLAFKSYQNAVRLDPMNGHATAMLKELK